MFTRFTADARRAGTSSDDITLPDSVERAVADARRRRRRPSVSAQRRRERDHRPGARQRAGQADARARAGGRSDRWPSRTTNCAASEPTKIALIRRPISARLAPVRADSAGSTGPSAAMRKPADEEDAAEHAEGAARMRRTGAGPAGRAHAAGPKIASWTPCRSVRIASAGRAGRDAVGEQHDVGVADVVDPQRRAGEAGVADRASGS